MSNHENSLTLGVIEQFVLKLLANPGSTGYSWKVSQCPECVTWKELSPEHVGPPTIGGPVLQVFQFNAILAGEGNVILQYERPWEHVPPAKKYPISVVVIR
jgi:inhibitor of cysteine peptidase